MDLVNGAGVSVPRNGSGLIANTQANDNRRASDDQPELVPSGSLNSLIEEEIIPRLLLVHSSDRKRSGFFEGRRVKPAEAKRFATLPIEHETDRLLAEIEALQASGVSMESIFVDLLAVSARKIGEMWEDDSCDFVDVTVGLWRLHEVMRECVVNTWSQFDSLGASNTALFLPMLGDQHNFGTLMVEEVFANAGWQTEVLLEPQRYELIHLLAERPFDLVGLTVSSNCPSRAVADLITSIRSVSKNSKVRVIVGGSWINAEPSLALGVGADGTAADARSALALAERIVAGSEPVISPVP